MTDEFALRRDTEAATRARVLLEDETLKSAFDTLEASYIKQWQATSARDTDARERLWTAVNVIGKVREHLGTLVSGGTLAQRQLDDLENRSNLDKLRRTFAV